jgi:hypothetical protein
LLRYVGGIVRKNKFINMKQKIKLGNKLQLDKEIISRLDEEQMSMIAGGGNLEDCSTGGSRCSCTNNSCNTKAAGAVDEIVQ